MDPAWLAGIISYETGGTFDPAQAGPTTQWGQHRGLIQFGEPQARRYGVDWSDPMRSQLGPDGAVVNYFLDNGWQPGMSLEQAYATVNAGSPYRTGATDENNGGAPGTVSEKVRLQFGPHLQKGAALLGGNIPYNMGEPAGNSLAPEENKLAKYMRLQQLAQMGTPVVNELTPYRMT